jgi:DNA repair photolyase
MEKAQDRRTDGQTDGGFATGQTPVSEAEATTESLTARPRPSPLGSAKRDPGRGSPLGPVRLPAWLAFEKQILVKTSAAAVLARTLFPAKLAGASLVIGTATDPYQPAERRFRLTRSILEALRSWRGLSLGIITKSPLILRDRDLLGELAERHELTVNISLASVDAALLRRVEARSPAPHARLRAVKGLVDAGIHAGIMMAPVIPGVTDSREALAAVMAAGKAAGARYVVGAALRLGPAARTRFLPHLAQEFPELVERYTRRFGHSESPGQDYVDALARRIRSLQREYGFPVNSGMNGRQRHGNRTPRAVSAIPQSAEQWTLL